MTLTLHEITEVEARANAATPGPWEYERGDEGCSMGEIASASDGRMFKVCGDSAQQYHNADFIAAARSDVAALCETARQLIQERDQLIGHLQTLVACYEDGLLENACGNFGGFIAIDNARNFLAQVTKEPPNG